MLQEAPPGEREAHVCTHNPDDHGNRQAQSDQGSETGQRREGTGTRGKKKQPNAELIRKYVATLDERFDAFTAALSGLTGLLEADDVDMYNDHLIVWAEYVGDMRDRAFETAQILDAALLNTTRLDKSTNQRVPVAQGTADGQHEDIIDGGGIHAETRCSNL